MQIGGEIIFLGLAIAVYIYILLSRICQCFETCANHKMMAMMYSTMNPDSLQELFNKAKET